MSPTTAIIEIMGKEDKLKALTDLLGPYGEHLAAHTHSSVCKKHRVRIMTKNSPETSGSLRYTLFYHVGISDDGWLRERACLRE